MGHVPVDASSLRCRFSRPCINVGSQLPPPVTSTDAPFGEHAGGNHGPRCVGDGRGQDIFHRVHLEYLLGMGQTSCSSHSRPKLFGGLS